MKRFTIFAAVTAALTLGACDDKKKDDAKVAEADAKKAEAEKAPEPETPEEPPADEAAPEGPPYTHVAFARFKVKDYDAYKEALGGNESLLAQAGAKEHHLHQDPENPNLVMVSFGVDGGLDKFKQHLESEAVKKVQAEHWDGEPEYMLLGEIKYGKPAPEGTESAGEVFIAHQVADFDKWLEAFKGHESARADASVVTEGVIIGEDGKTVGIHLGYTDADKMKAFMESEDLKKVMADAGVEGEPTIFWAKETDEKEYQTEVAQK